MPVDQYGNRADAIMDPSSVLSRMNPGRLYEQYFNATSRHVQHMTRDLFQTIRANHNYNTLQEFNTQHVKELFTPTLEMLALIDTEQYSGYKALYDNNDVSAMKVVLEEILEKELYILYRVSSKLKPYQVVMGLKGTPYEPPMGKIVFTEEGKIRTTINDMFIAPSYLILLAKTADSYLSTASAKTNHYGLPIGVSNNAKNRLPWRNSPVKILSETESRLYLTYVSTIGFVELKDRANSISTHKHVYRSLLSVEKPTSIQRIVDRNKVPFGNDASLELVNNIFNAGGIKITYVPERK